MTAYRVLVTGSRSWCEPDVITSALDALLAEHGTLTVVHGANRAGADAAAHKWALNRRHESPFGAVTVEPHPADWYRRGKGAGFIRNQEMVSAGADLCLAFIDACTLFACDGRPAHGSHGASDCAERAAKAGIPVRRLDG